MNISKIKFLASQINIEEAMKVLSYKGYPSKEYLPEKMNWNELEKMVSLIKLIQTGT